MRKVSDIFEGVGSSLHQAFNMCLDREKNDLRPTRELFLVVPPRLVAAANKMYKNSGIVKVVKNQKCPKK